MQPPSLPSPLVRFGPFIANLHSGELYKGGTRLKLQEQPFRILAALLEHPGQVVTREELRKKLWDDNTFVDFDHGINMAIAKIREALGDSSEEPQFLETVGRRGYRFIATLEPTLEKIATLPSRVLPATRHSVGREKEFGELTAAYASVAGGHGTLVCVAGEPGIGKTTLVEDFLSGLYASGESFSLARGRCSERLAGEEAYLPFLEALESLLRNDDNKVANKLRTFAPSWYVQLLPLSETDASGAGLQTYARATTQERVKREFAAFLREITSQNPLVLFFDDLHWADASTVDLLAYLATKFDSTRILLIGAYRPSDLILSGHRFIGVKLELQARGTCQVIDVELLSVKDVERYLALEFPENHFPSEFAGVIHSRTEGNPLFMVDLLRYLRDKEVIFKKEEEDQAWRLALSLPDLSREFPQSAHSMIERKIEQVNTRDREVLTTAAAQGYEFDSATVARGLEAADLEIEEVLDRLNHVHGFARRVNEEELPRGVLTIRYRFVHVLYQNALYASLTPTRRAVLSAALARTLEALYGDRSSAIASQLAFLYEAARDPGRASDYFLLAAQNAARIFANREAIALARRGLTQLMKLPDTPERARKELELQITLGFSLLWTQGYAAPETGAAMSRARELCLPLGDTVLLFPILTGLWTYYLCKADLKTTREAGEQLLAMSRSLSDPALVLGAHAAMAFTFHHQGELAASRLEFEEVAKLYDVAQHGRYVQLYKFDPGIHAESEMIRTLWLLGYPDRTRQQLEKTLALARAAASPLSLAFCQLFAAWAYQHLRLPEKTKEFAETCIALCDEHGIMLERAWVMCPYGWAIAELGKAEEGISLTRIGLDTQLSIGAQIVRPQCLASLTETLWHAGHTEAALQAVEEGLEVSNLNGERYYDAELWRLKGELLKKPGKAAEAESCFQKAIEIALQQSAKSLELRASASLARLWRKQGKQTEARQLLGKIYAWFTEGFDTADLQEAASLFQELS